MRKIPYVLVVILCTAALIAGCNLPFLQQADTAAVQTSAALTVQAQLGQPVGVATPTSTTAPFPTLPPVNTALPTNTQPPPATPTSNCDSASFIADVTYPDNTVVASTSSFTKTWRLKNIGTCSWTPSYAVVFINGTSMNGPSVQALAGNVNPGQTVDVSVNLEAPGPNGTYTGNWGLRNAAGVIFSHFYVQIVVNSGGGGGGPFAVIHVTYDLGTFTDGSYHDCPVMTAHITTSSGGDVSYHWTRSDGASAPVQTIHFNSGSTMDVTEQWRLGSVWNGQSHWLGIYIDSPNHQDFGHLSFTTACSSP